jgi:hypothetical protein
MTRNPFRALKSFGAVKFAALLLVFVVAGVAWSRGGVASSATNKVAALVKGPMSLFQSAKARVTGTAVPSVPGRITQAIDETKLVTLARNTRPEAKMNFDRGEVSESMPVEHMLLVLQRSTAQEQELEKLIDEMNDRKSPNFHKWLTAEELGQRFGVSQQDIDTVTSWLVSHGFRVNTVYASHIMIDFSGTAGSIKEAFHSPIHNLNVNGVMHVSNMRDPQIPAALAPVVKGIFSLNDFKPHPMYKLRPDYTFAGCAASAGVPTEPGTCYGITPQDNQTIYDLNPLYNAGISGQGQTIVLVEDTDTYGVAGSSGKSDWNTYRSVFGLESAFPQGTYTQVHPGGCTDPGTNGDDGEAAIDVEVASGIAPSAAIELISCPSGTLTFGGLIALQNLVNGSAPYPGIVSMSYGLCEALTGTAGNAGFYNTMQQAASEGISVFASAGDGGPSGCGGDFGVEYDVASLGITGWGESPYNVSVGGTDFEDVYNSKEGGAALSTYWSAMNTSGYGSALSYIPEIPWNDSCASVLISEVATSSFTTYGASPATCNNATFDTTTTYLSTGAGAGGASNCATGAGGTDQSSDLDTVPQCQGYAKPSYQSGAALSGGLAVYGQPSDGVRDIPDVSMFAANGVWGHFEVVCWSDPSQTTGGATSCSGAPSTWAGFGGTSVAAPTMAAVQALVNQKTGQTWGNPNPIYYQIAQNEYGTAGGSFLGSSCNSSGAGGPASTCAFNDITQGDIDLACEDNGTLSEAQCYKPTGTHGVDSTDNVTAATIISGGSGYTTAPTCTIAGPSNNNPYKSPTGTALWAGGTQATCTAAVTATSTTGAWTVKIGAPPGGSATTGAPVWTSGEVSVTVGATTYTFVTALTGGGTANQVLLEVISGSTTTQETDVAKNLEAAINANSAQCEATPTPCFGSGTVANASATATESTSTVTLTAKAAGYAGAFNVTWGPGYFEGPDIITITNTTVSEGPNYVSGITIGTAGTGYQPDTPITLTGGGGSGAIAVANTSVSTAAQSYQPSYGAAPGYDMATGLGSVNANALVNSSVWAPLNSGTPGIYSPDSGSTLWGATQTFYWNAYPGATAYYLDLGSAQGGNTYLDSGSLSSSTLSYTVTDMPTNGSAVWARWYYFYGGTWLYNDYSYTASTAVTAYPSGDSIATMTTPANNATLTGANQTFTWTAGIGPTLYNLDIGSTVGGNNYYSHQTTSLSAAVTGLPTNGSTIYVTLASQIAGSWYSNAYTYTAESSALAVMQSPTPSTMLSGSSVAFTWSTGSGVTQYWLDVGSSAGGNQYYSQSESTNTTATVSGLPVNGSTVYVTLYSYINSQWQSNAYTYTAFNPSAAEAVISSPTSGSTLTGSSVTFTWNSVAGAQAYWLDLGSSSGGNQYYSQNQGTGLSVTVGGLPTNGSQVYATLYTEFSGTWYSNSTSYTAATNTAAVITAPSPGSPLTGASQAFTWSTGSGVTQYSLDAGSTSGGNQYYSQNEGTNTSATVTGLPVDGSTVYVTLWSLINGSWTSNTYTFTAALPATMTSPTNGSSTSGGSATFIWSTGTSVTNYYIDIGSSAGANDIYSASQGTNTTATINGLPTNGETIYVTLYSLIGGTYYSTQTSYTAGP